MNILLNFFPVQSGGGQQVASSFLRNIAENSFGHKWFVFVGRNSTLYFLSKEILPEESILDLQYSYISRLCSVSKVKGFVKANQIDLIYNYAPVLPVRGIPQVVRSVYSNLYFPEIDFWSSYPPSVRFKKRLIDYMRLRGTLKADGLMFENESMLKRAVSLFNYPRDQVIYIAPSVSKFDESKSSNKYSYLADISYFKILYLSTWHLNKNIHLLPSVSVCLKNHNIKVKFILSLSLGDENIPATFYHEIRDLKVEDYFEFIGTVEPQFVHQVIKHSDAMILLSKLECFSSNVVEAFHFGRPLIISKEEWAMAACQDAAIYVDRSSAFDVCQKISQLVSDAGYAQEKVKLGGLRLKDFNSPQAKVHQQVRFLEIIHDKYERKG